MKYPSTKALNISLATFDFEKETCDDSENEIELGILKQLFYKVDSDKIPQSRYRKIKKKYYRKYFIITTILMIIVMFGIALFAPDVIDELSSKIMESGKKDATRSVVVYIVHNKEKFMDNIENITLDIDIIGELLKNNDLEDFDKLQLMVLRDSEDMNEDIAKSIRNMEVKVKKEYVESAWNLLNESDRYQLLLNQLEVYTVNEISEKFKSLALCMKHCQIYQEDIKNILM